MGGEGVANAACQGSGRPPDHSQIPDGQDGAPVRRCLVNFVTALSLLLCVAVLLLWVRSYAVCDSVVHTRVGATGQGVHVREWDGAASRGVLRLRLVDYVWNGSSHGLEMHSGPYQKGNWWRRSRQPPVEPLTGFWFPNTFWHRCGFAAFRQSVPSVRPPGHVGFIAFPLWLPAAIFAAVPVKRLLDRVLKSHAAGACGACGYDLRATPDRCPECGTAAPKKPAPVPR